MQTNDDKTKHALQAIQPTKALATNLNCYVNAIAEVEKAYQNMHFAYAEHMYGLGYEESVTAPENSILNGYSALVRDGLIHIEVLKQQFKREQEWAKSILTWATAAGLLEQPKPNKNIVGFKPFGISSFFTKWLVSKRHKASHDI